MRQRNPSRPAAFTLIELLVVIAIINPKTWINLCSMNDGQEIDATAID